MNRSTLGSDYRRSDCGNPPSGQSPLSPWERGAGGEGATETAVHAPWFPQSGTEGHRKGSSVDYARGRDLPAGAESSPHVWSSPISDQRRGGELL